MENEKLGIRKWLSFIVAGLIGQLAWAIENNYLNFYVFDCTNESIYVTYMTAFSAVAATITTLFMGALSDRLGKRKLFISSGYIIWGLSIIMFAFLDPRKPYNIVAHSVLIAGTMIVIMDCVMTFFGSTANDAAFNAFVTDNTKPSNRGKVESVLSILPLVAMIAVVLLQGALVGDRNKIPELDWTPFFVIFGGITTLSGVALIFILPKDVKGPNKEEPYLKNIIHGFRPSVIKSRPKLYCSLLAFMVFNIAIQIFMPYFMIYININNFELVSTAGPILGVACVLTVILGFYMEKIGKYKLMYASIASSVVGGLLLFFFIEQAAVIIGGIILMTGYLLATAVLGAKIRDYTPENETGLFQGVRMVFVVMIPMVTGPFIGQGVSNIEPIIGLNDYGETTVLPNKYIFLFAAITLVFTIIPLLILMRKELEDGKDTAK